MGAVEDATAATAENTNGANVNCGFLDAATNGSLEVVPTRTQLYSMDGITESSGDNRTGEMQLSLKDIATTNRGNRSMDDNSDGDDSTRSHPRICFNEIAIPVTDANHSNDVDDDLSVSSTMDTSETTATGGQRTRIRTHGEATQGDIEDDDDLEFTRRVWEAKTGTMRSQPTTATTPQTIPSSNETQHQAAPLQHVDPHQDEHSENGEAIAQHAQTKESTGPDPDMHPTSTQNPPIQQSQSSSGVSASSSSIMAVARQVAETALDQERAQFILEVRNELTSTIVRAEEVDDSHHHNSSEQHSKSRIIRLWFLLALSIVGLVAVVSAVVSLRKHDKRTPSTTPQSTVPPMIVQTVAPTPTPIVYLDDGRRAFTTTPQLYDAVDSYHELLVMNPSGLNTSDIAITYGYPIGIWDVSRISDFSRVFDRDRDRALEPGSQPMKDNVFNEDLSGWDTSNAITMSGMFAGANKFAGHGLSDWNVSNVRDFSFLFKHASVFVGNISYWDTSSATTMDGMFLEARSFDGDLSYFDVSQVESMAFMFSTAMSYKGGDLTLWNVSNVRLMHGMFQGAGMFHGNVSTWDTRNVRQMRKMFGSAVAFSGDISSWSVGNVNDMEGMFQNALAMSDVDLSRWDTSRVMYMSSMFTNTPKFNGNLSLWDTSRVETFENMFEGSRSFNSDISRWNTSSATTMSKMFVDASTFASDVSMWDTREVNNMKDMFVRASSFNSDISRWDVSSVTDASYMLHGASKFNRNLCSWIDKLRPDAQVADVFVGTGCMNTSDPVAQIGPFCSNCDLK